MEPIATTPPSAEDPKKPFLVEMLRREETAAGYFRPEAQLVLTPALRTSGLLASLPPEDLKNLVFLLTFLSPSGHVLPTVVELASAMQVSEAKVRQRMQRLLSTPWQGQPLVVEVRRESGLDGYALSGHLYAVRQAPEAAPPSPPPLPPAAGREAVIAHSRERYTRPRAEVERMIAQQMGWNELEPLESQAEETKAKIRLKLRLLSVGVAREQADYLLAQYALEAIEQQLEWLPYRKAKNPAAFLVAAIEGDYEEPLPLRRTREAEQPGQAREAVSVGGEVRETPEGATEATAPALSEEDAAGAAEIGLSEETVVLPLPEEAAPSGGEPLPGARDE